MTALVVLCSGDVWLLVVTTVVTGRITSAYLQFTLASE